MKDIEKRPGGYAPDFDPEHGMGHDHRPGHEHEPGHGPHDGHGPTEIIVNGRRHIFEKKEISFEEVIALAFGSYETVETIAYTVTYSGGHHHDKQEGVLTRGLRVKVKKGMVFNATRTDRS